MRACHLPLVLRPLLPAVLALAGACSAGPAGRDAGAADAGGQDAGADAAAVPPQRCAIPLERFLAPGPGFARAKQAASAEDLVGGVNAWGRVGDFSLSNDKIRVVVQGPDRHIGPNPYGGTIIDADLVRGEGQDGRDQFGEVGLFYNLARTVDPDFVEILAEGGYGQPAVVAASGRDTAHNYLRIKNIFAAPGLDLDRALPFKITNYFILNPGEQRVRYVTAFCNESDEEQVTVAGDLTDPGWTVELFNGEACTGGFGYGGMCQGIDRMSWFGYQGDGVAYAYVPYRPESPYLPSLTNAMMTISGVTGTLLGADGMSGMSDWLNPGAAVRQGELRVPARGARAVARDFVVGRDLGEIASLVAAWRGALAGTDTGLFEGTVTRDGRPLAGARVALQRDGTVEAVFVTDELGRYAGRLPVGSYLASAWAPGSRPSPEAGAPAPVLQVRREGTARVDFALSAPRRLTVTVRDARTGAPLPAKVTMVCATGLCPAPWSGLGRFTDVVRDPIPDNVQLIDFVPPSGSATFTVPPGEYHVLVSRGPEWTIHPPDYPDRSPGAYLDLRADNGALEAELGHVVDTAGWASADFHAHTTLSPDSHVDPEGRALSFAAEGVDVLVATDHDHISDHRQAIAAVGAQGLLATVSGVEVSPLDFGHTNLYPLVPDPEDVITTGAIDWAGGRGDTLCPAQIFAAAREKGAGTVQINHPRGWPLGVLSAMRADMDTLATHADPALFGMTPQPGATAEDTRLLSAGFDAYEVLNSGPDDLDPVKARPCFNDWFTLLSRGLKVAGVGGSDSHRRFASASGYWRTFVQVDGDDDPSRLTPALVSEAVNAQRAVITNGPFVRIEAVRVSADGTPTSEPAGMGECLAASPDEIEVAVEVQAPTSMDFHRVELYLHQPGDDAACPIDPASPEAKTTRVACDGQSNFNWPQSGIAATETFTLGAADAEVAFTVEAVEWKRWRKRVVFRLPAPTTDNWIVAMVYGSRPLFPLVYAGLSGTGARAARPFAVTNPIYVDADGGGYDHPPFQPPARRSRRAAAAPGRPALEKRPPPLTPEEIARRWGAASGRR